MGTDWIYHNIWRYFSLIDLVEKSTQLNTWLGLHPYLWSHHVDYSSCTLCSEASFLSLMQGAETKQNKTRQKKTVFFYSKCWLSFGWMPRNFFNQNVLSLLPVRQGGGSILINTCSKLKPSALFSNQWISNFHDAVLGVTIICEEQSLYQGNTATYRVKSQPF